MRAYTNGKTTLVVNHDAGQVWALAPDHIALLLEGNREQVMRFIIGCMYKPVTNEEQTINRYWAMRSASRVWTGA